MQQATASPPTSPFNAAGLAKRMPCGHPAPMTSGNSGTAHAHPPYSGRRGVVTRKRELDGTVLYGGGVVDVRFMVYSVSCVLVIIADPRSDPAAVCTSVSDPLPDDTHLLQSFG